MKSISIIIAGIITAAGCSVSCSGNSDGSTGREQLQHDIDSMALSGRGTVGIAVITPDGDTIAANDSIRYPLMSVFKLHEALAVADQLDRRGHSFDSIISVNRDEVSADTWSPMLKDYPEGCFSVSIGELVKYALVHSDNNASNLLFSRITSVQQTDSMAHALTRCQDFQLHHTEHHMKLDHQSSYDNWSSPLACAELISLTFTDSIVSQAKQDSIRAWLGQCSSASERMAAAVKAVEGARLYHRTGSGYTNDRGEIIAVNDIGLIDLPDGRRTVIAVMIKDFPGSQEEADGTIAAITRRILSHFTQSNL